MRQEQDDKVSPGRSLEVTRAIAQWTRLSGTSEERASRGVATGPSRPTAALVYVGNGEPGDYTRAGAGGAFGLVTGGATPWHGVNAACAGVNGLARVGGRIAHEMGCPPVRNNLAESTAGALPRVILRPWR